MTKYLISAIWHDDKFRVTHVLLHYAVVNPGNITYHGIGIPVPKDAVVALIRHGYMVQTVVYNYQAAEMVLGAPVVQYSRTGSTFLRSVSNGEKVDNLDNLLPAGIFVNPNPFRISYQGFLKH